MKYFNSEEDYVQFIKNWKALAKTGNLKGRSYLFVLYNILRNKDLYHGFSENTKCHCLFLINCLIGNEIILYGYKDKRSYLFKLLENVNLNSEELLNDLKKINKEIIEKARLLKK